MKKALSAALSLLLILTTLTALPLSARAQVISGTTGHNTSFTLNTLTGIMEITGYGPVENDEFDATAFYTARDCGIQKLVVREGVTVLDTDYFLNLTQLRCVELESVKAITDGSFSGCTALEELRLGTVESIGSGAFLDCESLKEAILPDTVTDIGDHAFGYIYQQADETHAEGFVAYEGFTLTSGCSNRAAAAYIDRNEDIFWNARHDFNNAGTVTQKASFNHKAGTAEHSCNNGCGAVLPESIAPIKSLRLSKTEYGYNGKARKPAVTVLDNAGKKLTKDTDYTVTYAKNRKVGTAYATVTFKGKYEGKKKLSFTVLPPASKILSLTGQKEGKASIEWKKRTVQVDGFKIEASTGKKFTKKTTLTYTINTNQISKAILTKLAKGKRYYVRIRTFKTVGKKTYYSAYSEVKTVRTKKK